MHDHDIPNDTHPDDLRIVASSFQALADPTRLALMLHLLHGESTVTELVQRLEQPQSTVSRHLAVLRQVRLVQTRRHGTHVHYRLRNAHVGEWLRQAFAQAEHERLGLPDHDHDPPAPPNRIDTRERRS
jgi:DNA-binding transcriptional ArsR family regulator